MLKVAVCDDDWTFCEKIRKILEKQFVGMIEKIEDFSSGEELMESINSGNRYQMIFLDQEMKDMDGIATATAIRNFPEQQDAVLFFVTAYECEIVSVVDVHPFAYIRKPVDEKKFICSVQKALDIMDTGGQVIVIKKKSGNIILNPIKIQYIEAHGHGCEIWYDNHIVECAMSMNKMYESLCQQSKLFVKVHRSYVINMKYYSGIEKAYIVMKDNKKIPLGQKYQGDFLEKYSELFM